MKKLYYIVIFLFTALFLISCGGSDNNSASSDVNVSQNQKKVQNYSKTNNTKNKESKDKKKKKSLDIKETFNYKSMGKRDPFESPITKSEILSPQTTSSGTEFNYSRFSYKGLIELSDLKIALIEDGSGKGIRLKKGDSFGGATVVKITENRVVLEKEQNTAAGGSKKIILEKVESKGGK